MHDSCLHEANERALKLTREPARIVKNVCECSSAEAPRARCKIPAPDDINIIGAAAFIRRFEQCVCAEYVGGAGP